MRLQIQTKRLRVRHLMQQGPLNHAIVAKAHTPMYLIHKYWARKPHNVVSEYIKHYTNENDVVLDPFAGSGVTGLEALKLERKSISIDLNPMSEFIVENTLSKAKLKDVETAFDEIKKKLSQHIQELYETTCPKCNGKAITICLHWQNEKPIKIMYYCLQCKVKAGKEIQSVDLTKIKESEKLKPRWYPERKLAYNGLTFKEGTHNPKNETIDTLFTKRNLYALSLILEEIENIKSKSIQNLLKFSFTSMVHLASNMTPVRPTRQFSSFWPVHRYWIPPVYMESNVWVLFKSAVTGKQGLLRGIEDAQKEISSCKLANTFDELKNGDNILIKTTSALELTKYIPENSVDYIFTDPPYGGAVQYFELSTLWASWLKLDLDYADEITINTQQKKDFEYYHKMLKAAFREMYQVLKPNKFLTVTFHSTDIAVWNSIIKAVVLNGFDLEKIVYQPPARPSAKGLLQPYGSAVGDYYIRFRKPKNEKIISEKQIDMQSYEREVVLAAKRIIEERGEPTIYQHILNGIMVELKGGRYVPTGARNIEDVLKSNVGKEFELIPIKNNSGKIVGKKWWLKDRDFTNFSTPALSDRVETVILNVLDKKIKVSFDDILQEIFITFPNALTPDAEDVQNILKDYAGKTADGKWRLLPEMQEKERVTNHSRMIYYLAVLGKKAGFNIWVGIREQSELFNGKPLKNAMDNIGSFRFVPQERSILDRIKMIDLLWIDEGRIKYEFEVENTTGISDAIIRGSHIPDELNVKRFIVIPKERERKMHKRLEEPIIKTAVERGKWKFLRYGEIEKLYNSAKKQFNPKDLEAMGNLPQNKPDGKQTTLALDPP